MCLSYRVLKEEGFVAEGLKDECIGKITLNLHGESDDSFSEEKSVLYNETPT